MLTLFKDPFYSIFDEVMDANNFYKTPQITVRKDDESYKILMAVPGLTKEDIKISVKENVLSISYQREEKTDKTHFVNNFNKSYTLPDNIIEDKIKGKVENGLLILTIPFLNKKPLERLISLN